MMRLTAFVISSLITAHASLVAAQAVPPPATTPRGTSSYEAGSRETVSGKIVGYTTTQQGKMNGIVLDSGVTVHFPARAGTDLTPLVGRGQRVIVGGTMVERGGTQMLVAKRITNPAMRRSIEVSPGTQGYQGMQRG